MSLLTFDVPKDIIGHIKNTIKEESESLSQKPDSPAKKETEGRIEKYTAFVNFLELPDASKPVEAFFMSVDGRGSSANMLILEAF